MSFKSVYKTPEYKVWASIKRRCYPSENTTTIHEKYNIIMCERWMKFKNFIEDVGYKPTSTSKLIRINPKDGYTPNNCIWSEKTHITIDSKWVVYKRKKVLLKDLCKELDLKYQTVYARLRRGWSVEDAFEIKPNKSNKALRLYEGDYSYYRLS